MFVDNAKVSVKAGDGGDGAISFRHEKFVDKGGPDGGDGGNGGDVVFEAHRNQNTLASFRYQKQLSAEDGKPGSKRKRHGKNGKNLVVKVPVGTVINDLEGNTLADLVKDNQKAIVALGGKGGYGNAHFTSSTRQTPRVAEKGEKGDELDLVLELKMIADVGLIGLPNAGKSTFLSVVSNARPEIANYPFTTLTPNLGAVDIDERALLVADIPGLIEGASKGKGLGDEFLKHVERTKVLVHLVDIYNDDLEEAYTTIIQELKAYKTDMSDKPQVVALSKIDGLDDEIIEDRKKELAKVLPKEAKLFAISSKSKQGVVELLREVKSVVEKAQPEPDEGSQEEELPVLTIRDENSWLIEKVNEGYRVSGRKIERFAARTDFENFHAVARLRDIMKKMGIMNGLRRKGVEPGDKVYIADNFIEY